MNKVEKFLQKLSDKHQLAILLVIDQLTRDYQKVPGIKPLIGKKDWYRVRVGKYRIIFLMKNKGDVDIKVIANRDDNTYKNL